jgi:Rtf2 RING-finger
MSGTHRFCALWSCGCVFSERALKELKSSVCSICQTPYNEQDVIVLNGTDEDVDAMKTKMEARVARIKAEKKDKKSKVKKEVVETVVNETSTSESLTLPKQTKGIMKTEPGSSKGFKPSFIANLSKTSSQKRELISDVIGTDPSSKKSKKDYSVQKDEQATEVYKSIFTSHESEQTQERAHWITYNPFYN